MEYENSMRLSPPPDSSHNTRVLLYGLAVFFIILIALISGFLIAKNNPETNKNLVVLISPTPAPTSIWAQSETSNWQTYTDSIFGFSFKYPPDWTYESVSNQNQTSVDPSTGKPYFTDTHAVYFSIKGNDPKQVTLRIAITVHTNINNWNLDQYVNEEMYGNGKTYLGTTNPITLDGQPAIKGVFPPSSKNVYVVAPSIGQKKGYLVTIVLYGNDGAVSGGACATTPCPTIKPSTLLKSLTSSEPSLVQAVSEFDRMLTTFSFTSQLAADKSCQTDSDCTLRECTGCFNAQWAKSAPVDLACMEYQGYACKCTNHVCTPYK